MWTLLLFIHLVVKLSVGASQSGCVSVSVMCVFVYPRISLLNQRVQVGSIEGPELQKWHVLHLDEKQNCFRSHVSGEYVWNNITFKSKNQNKHNKYTVKLNQTRQKVWSLLSHLTHLVAVVGPGAKGQVALLPVEGEVGDVHHTCALCDRWRVPDDLAIITQLHVSGRFTCRLLICSAQTYRAEDTFVEACTKSDTNTAAF